MRSDKVTSDATPTFIERARRAQLVAAAIEVLATEGFAGASLTRIAREAGLTKGALLYHFGSRDALMQAVIVDSYTAAGESIAPVVEATGDHRERLAAYIRGNLAYLDTERVRVRALTQVLLHFRGDDGRLVFDESQVASVVEPLQSMLRAGQTAGAFRDFDTWVMARTVRAAIDVVTPRLGVEPDFDVPAHAEHLVDLFHHATRS